jgi:hypothetical protein
MKLRVKAQVKRKALSESQIENGPFTVGQVNFDNRSGLGSVSDCANVVYMGAVAMMKPSNFLRLAAAGKEEAKIGPLKEKILEGVALGSPFLSLDDSKFETTGMMQVTGHEGRHRCYAIQAVQQDEPIPVCVFIRGLRARHWTPEILKSLNKGVQCEKSTSVASGVFEGFWVDDKWISKAELG